MLIDDLIADKGLQRELRGGHKMLKAKAERAMKFVYQEDVAYAADQVFSAGPSSVLESLPVCRCPYRITWLETWHHFRPSLYSPENHREDTARPIDGVGVLLEVDETFQRGMAYLGWRYKTGGVSLSPYAMMFDWTDGKLVERLESEWQIRRPRFQLIAELGRANEDRGWPGYERVRRADRKKELAAQARIEEIHTHVSSQFHVEYMKALKQATDNGVIARRQAQLYSDAWLRDWQGEMIFWMGCLIFLNSKQSISVKDSDNRQINKKRRVLGKRPLYSHKTVQLRLTKEERAQFMHGDRDMRAHLVRGHFKRRPTGIYWWRPHIRGDMEAGFVDKDYEVGA